MVLRLDDILKERGIVGNKNGAFVLVTEGRVLVNGQKAISPAQPVNPEAKIEIRENKPYVGRGAYKLEAALEKFGLSSIVKGKICVDIGAATGGFTEVLLKYGAKKVYAIDTSRGKLALKLRTNPRVVVMEGTDIRSAKIRLPDIINLVTIDVSLLPLRRILPFVRGFLDSKGAAIALFKPQYETYHDSKILKHGVVRDPAAREKLLNDFIAWTKENGWTVKDRMESPITGGKGNVEYLLWLLLS